MYPPQLIDHFEHPRNAGTMDSPDISVQAENPACGDVMKLMLRIHEGNLRRESLVEALGGLANESMHASYLAMDCLKLALKQLKK